MVNKNNEDTMLVQSLRNFDNAIIWTEVGKL